MNMLVYMLMHEDIKIALVGIDNGTVVKVRLNKKNMDHLPFGVFNASGLSKWLAFRGIPVTRYGIQSDLKAFGIDSTFRLMLSNYGLSLTDHYWLCELNSDYSWKNINLYTNSFKASYSLDLKDDIKSIAGRTNFMPSASLKGDLKKKWIIDDNGIRRLVKGNYNNTCRQSLCEVFAAAMHELQGYNCYTPYSLIKISSGNDLILGCECPNFTGISTEFVSAADIIGSLKKPNDISYYELYIKSCLQMGLDVRSFMEYQIMTDFIISNSDRHLNNFGIIRDSRALKWLHPAPIFDSGNSMFYNLQYIPVDKELLNLKVTSFLTQEIQLLRYVQDRSVLDVSRLPDDNFLFSLLKKDSAIKDSVNERLVEAYNKKIKYFTDFQNGADIWKHAYKG